MLEVSLFTLEQHSGPYETWPLKTHLLKNGERTQRFVPGFVIDAQYRYKDYYLLVTSWDCPFEENYEFLLLSEDLRVVSKRRLGVWYSTEDIEAHWPISESEVLFRCWNRSPIIIEIKPTSFLRRHARLKMRETA